MKLNTNVVEEFCKIALEFIRKGLTAKAIFKGAGEKLGIAPDVVEHGVEGLSNLFTEAARHVLNEIDFVDSLMIMSFPSELNAGLKDFYLQNRTEIRSILNELAFVLPHYYDLDWRLDVQLSSRAVRNQATPVYLLNLQTKTPETQSELLQTDFNSLRYITKELEAALSESKSSHSRRIMRNVK